MELRYLLLEPTKVIKIDNNRLIITKQIIYFNYNFYECYYSTCNYITMIVLMKLMNVNIKYKHIIFY